MSDPQTTVAKAKCRCRAKIGWLHFIALDAQGEGWGWDVDEHGGGVLVKFGFRHFISKTDVVMTLIAGQLACSLFWFRETANG